MGMTAEEFRENLKELIADGGDQDAITDLVDSFNRSYENDMTDSERVYSEAIDAVMDMTDEEFETVAYEVTHSVEESVADIDTPIGDYITACKEATSSGDTNKYLEASNKLNEISRGFQTDFSQILKERIGESRGIDIKKFHSKSDLNKIRDVNALAKQITWKQDSINSLKDQLAEGKISQTEYNKQYEKATAELSDLRNERAFKVFDMATQGGFGNNLLGEVLAEKIGPHISSAACRAIVKDVLTNRLDFLRLAGHISDLKKEQQGDKERSPDREQDSDMWEDRSPDSKEMSSDHIEGMRDMDVDSEGREPEANADTDEPEREESGELGETDETEEHDGEDAQEDEEDPEKELDDERVDQEDEESEKDRDVEQDRADEEAEKDETERENDRDEETENDREIEEEKETEEEREAEEDKETEEEAEKDNEEDRENEKDEDPDKESEQDKEPESDKDQEADKEDNPDRDTENERESDPDSEKEEPEEDAEKDEDSDSETEEPEEDVDPDAEPEEPEEDTNPDAEPEEPEEDADTDSDEEEPEEDIEPDSEEDALEKDEELDSEADRETEETSEADADGEGKEDDQDSDTDMSSEEQSSDSRNEDFDEDNLEVSDSDIGQNESSDTNNENDEDGQEYDGGDYSEDALNESETAGYELDNESFNEDIARDTEELFDRSDDLNDFLDDAYMENAFDSELNDNFNELNMDELSEIDPTIDTMDMQKLELADSLDLDMHETDITPDMDLADMGDFEDAFDYDGPDLQNDDFDFSQEFEDLPDSADLLDLPEPQELEMQMDADAEYLAADTEYHEEPTDGADVETSPDGEYPIENEVQPDTDFETYTPDTTEEYADLEYADMDTLEGMEGSEMAEAVADGGEIADVIAALI